MSTEKPSDQKIEELQSEITKLRKERDAAEHAKSEYMQNVAHQLAAPINAIKLNIDALKRPRIPLKTAQGLLNSIYCQGTILAHLVKNFSLMSDLEANHNLESFREEPEHVDLCLLCVSFVKDFQPIADAKKLKIEVLENEFERHRRPRVWAIKNLLSQVVYNLLENATKYSDRESDITIGLEVNDTFYSVRFTSSGAPISPDEARTIFNRGVRGAAAKARHPAGTGFGLYIARRIMEIHNGTLTVATNRHISAFKMNCRKG
ncbi:MAG: HAMP domain-containing histidine kinase [Verrucomicrobia bacterium]|nr:HAMP domain-containing histidine kinase [Verrucomicrobiota bacterium]